MVHEIIQQNAEEIAAIFDEAAKKFNGKQISVSCDIVFNKYNEIIFNLSDGYCTIERFLSNTNIESNRYKVTLRCQSSEDKKEIEKYILEL